MNKIKKTKKLNDYLSLEYDIEDLSLIRIWYTCKNYSSYALYDTKDNRFICWLNFTDKQKDLIINAINKLVKGV